MKSTISAKVYAILAEDGSMTVKEVADVYSTVFGKKNRNDIAKRVSELYKDGILHIDRKTKDPETGKFVNMFDINTKNLKDFSVQQFLNKNARAINEAANAVCERNNSFSELNAEEYVPDLDKNQELQEEFEKNIELHKVVSLIIENRESLKFVHRIVNKLIKFKRFLPKGFVQKLDLANDTLFRLGLLTVDFTERDVNVSAAS